MCLWESCEQNTTSISNMHTLAFFWADPTTKIVWCLFIKVKFLFTFTFRGLFVLGLPFIFTYSVSFVVVVYYAL